MKRLLAFAALTLWATPTLAFEKSDLGCLRKDVLISYMAERFGESPFMVVENDDEFGVAGYMTFTSTDGRWTLAVISDNIMACAVAWGDRVERF